MSTTVEIQDARNRLADLVKEAAGGTDIVLTDAGVPVARLMPIHEQPKQAPRIPGLHPRTVWMSDDFNDPLPDEFWLGKNEVSVGHARPIVVGIGPASTLNRRDRHDSIREFRIAL